jgi:geranylgeranyl diphosphate synthase, type I
MDESLFKQLPKIKKQIDHTIARFLLDKKEELANSGRISKLVFDHLSKFVINGKCTRGAVFYYFAKYLGFHDEKVILKLSAAIELAHSANVIHSDVFMDETFSRHHDSTWQHFLKKIKQDSQQSKEISKSVAILAGDLAFILATELFRSSTANHKNSEKIINKFLIDYSYNKLGQIENYYLTGDDCDPTEKEIINIFKNGTAKYTFSTPFFIAASLANRSNKFISDFSELGTMIGIIFKIRDDDVNFYIESEKIGKTMGLDLNRNTKNLIHHCFYKKSSIEEKNFLDKIYGKFNLTLEEKEKVKELYVPTGAYAEVCRIKSIYTDKALKIIKKLKINRKIKNAIMDLLIYSISRTE